MPENFTPSSKREILRVFFTRWLGILAIIVIVVGATVLATLRAPKWYESRISFRAMKPQSINPLASPQNPYLPTEVFLRTQQAIILSEDVVARALASLDGATGQAITDKAQLIRETQQKRLARPIKHIKITTTSGENFSNSEIFYINVEVADDPSQAKELAEAIATEYRAKFDTLQKRPLSQSTAILKAEVGELKNRLDAANGGLEDFITKELKGDDYVALRSITSAVTPISVAGVATAFDQEVKILQANLSEKAALKAELDKEFSRVSKLNSSSSEFDPLDTANIPVVPERLLKDKLPGLFFSKGRCYRVAGRLKPHLDNF